MDSDSDVNCFPLPCQPEVGRRDSRRGRKEGRKKESKKRKKERNFHIPPYSYSLTVRNISVPLGSFAVSSPAKFIRISVVAFVFCFFKPHCLISDPVHDSSAFVENTLFLFPISTTLISITLRYRLYREQVASCLGSVPRASVLLQFLIQHFFYCSFIFEEKMAPLVIRLVRYQRG